VVIGLGVTLAVTTLLIAGENHKRTTTSTNDAEQTGSYAFYALDKVVRGAGSAIAESAYPTDRGVLGCKLNASSIFPRTTAFPYPFGNFLAGVTNTLTVAPVLIGQGQSQNGSDVIAVMGGSGAAGGVSRQISGGGSATTMSLDNTVGFLPNDVALVSQSGVVDCLLEEVASVAAPVLNVGGTTYYTATGTTTNLATLTANTLSYVTPIGNAAANNIQFMLFGVDSNRRLYSYDLLQNLNFVNGVGTDVAQAFADGVVQMNAIYGIDTNGDGIQDNWAGPGVPSSDAAWNITNVMANPSLMREIVSIRIALVVRGEYYDKNVVTPATLTLFNGLTNSAAAPLTQVINLAPTDQHYRYRIFEFTVPLRNMLLLAGVS
jgi:type IV pilus assembly protein PilW